MSYPTTVLNIVKSLKDEMILLGASKLDSKPTTLYDQMITNKILKSKTEKLFKDGHHARSVEEAYKLLDNLVKQKAFASQTSLTGASLMQTVFSVKRPLLRMNEGISVSEQDEQLGYMSIFAGCMTGIRNPRAHDSDWEDTEQRALQLLTMANHLIERVSMAEKS